MPIHFLRNVSACVGVEIASGRYPAGIWDSCGGAAVKYASPK